MMLDLPGGGWLAWDFTGVAREQYKMAAGDRLGLALRLASAFDLPAVLVIGEAEFLAMVEDADREWLRGVQSRVLST